MKKGQAAVALPGEPYAQIAEAWGAGLALWLICRHVRDLAAVRVFGDNLAVVRYCAAQCRIRKPDMAGVLEAPLAQAALGGHDVQWAAVRRRYNTAADEVATLAVTWAAGLCGNGSYCPRTYVHDGAGWASL